MKKLLSTITIVALLFGGLFVLSGCGNKEEEENTNNENVVSNVEKDENDAKETGKGNAQIVGDTVVFTQYEEGAKIEHVFYYENEELKKGVATATLSTNAEAKVYKSSLEEAGLFNNFKIDKNVVTCDYSEDVIVIYKQLDKEELVDTLNSIVE